MTRRPRQPRPCVNPIEAAMAGARLLLPGERGLLLDPPREALEALRTGTGRGDSWRAMADALNVAEALIEQSIGGEDLEKMIQSAQVALSDLAVRVAAGRGWTLYGPELLALGDGLWAYRIQLDHCCVSEWQGALQTVKNRISAALAGNGGPRVTVHAPEVAA